MIQSKCWQYKTMCHLDVDVDMLPERDEDGFSGFCLPNHFDHPYLHLNLNVDETKNRYELCLMVFDDDDYCVEKDYQCNAENYRRKTHELINWMIDQHLRYVDCSDPYGDDFFPEV